jgi:hypothetical protein
MATKTTTESPTAPISKRALRRISVAIVRKDNSATSALEDSGSEVVTLSPPVLTLSRDFDLDVDDRVARSSGCETKPQD